MSYEVEALAYFLKRAKRLLKKYPSLDRDVESLATSLREDPFQGAALGKNLFKVRMAISSKGKGKSGGARVVTFVKVVRKRIYLLDIYDKSERDTLSARELGLLMQRVPHQ